MHGRPLITCHLEGNICYSKISVDFSACKLSLPRALIQPLNVAKIAFCFFYLLLIMIWMVLVFCLEHTTSDSSKKDKK